MTSKFEVIEGIMAAIMLSGVVFMLIGAVLSLIVTSFSLSTVWWFATVISFSAMLFIQRDLNNARAK